MSTRGSLGALAIAVAIVACNRPLDQDAFRRETERAYLEVNAGWSIAKRDGMVSYFVRGDQLDRLDVAAMFAEYQASKQSGSAWLDAWSKKTAAEAEKRRRTLAQAKDDLIPVLKSGSWIRVQDLGAIGPKHLVDKIRPWRKEVTADVFVLLGIPEERLGYRVASLDDVREANEKDDVWLERAIVNLRKKVATSTASEIRTDGDKLLVWDLSGYEAISALILDPRFRADMLEKFGKEELGAAVPLRDVLIVFDNAEFTATKPVRARTHALYDTQNHPAFRGLLRFDKSGLSILEPANPEQKKKPVE